MATRLYDAIGYQDRPAATTDWRKALRSVIGTVLVWHERARQRRQLQALDLNLLKDMGIDPADAERESVKPFWRA